MKLPRRPNLKEEKNLWKQGYQMVAGVDEVGRGAWAGPLIAAAVILPPQIKLPRNLRDSKLLTPRQRELIGERIKKEALYYNFGLVEVTKINRYGTAWATQKALTGALLTLEVEVDFALVDYFRLQKFPKRKHKSYVKGDQRVASIAAASVLAKVYRDSLMVNYGKEYKEYSLEKNKGYGTKEHQVAIERYGLTPIHRINFIPEGLAKI